MKYNYDGIKSEAFWLLGQNKFNNSKEFYEENKLKIKRLVVQPMQQIAQIMAEDMVKLDDAMNLVPTRMVSRVRRDTRFSRDKSLYRENIWIMFMRPKAEWPTYPCMWFEIQPQGYSYGVSCFETTPRFMEFYRKALLEHSEEFLLAAHRAETVGAVFYSEQYKKEKNKDVPEELKKYFNVKNMYFMAKSSDLSALESERVINELKVAYAEYAPLYEFFKRAADEYISLD